MKYIKLLVVVAFTSLAIFSCNKGRESGVCYCDYFSGDSKEYDLSDLTRSEQIDQCYVHDSNAEGFGGSCELE